MSFLNSLSTYFNKLQANYKLKCEHEEIKHDLIKALWTNDQDSFDSQLQKIGTTHKDVFIEKHGNRLLQEVIKRGDIESFTKIYNLVGNPNVYLEFTVTLHRGRAGSMEHSYLQSILYTAIKENKPHIAEYIAKDTRTDLDKGSYNYGEEKSCLDCAERAVNSGYGMDKVLKILYKHEAGKRQREANLLLKKAGVKAR